ncbi:hypothetical protein L596_029692 [Steinernema carpocapsae]|uniref:MD-2-related lipid-recognition domain-containing protein n=1 Tax=Steinernema carpocapsae TaxID=34508 RepID=A0A4U5LQI0_STECR|nr:hypothetical protein L596_029692 [Steinernema carpocapsae]
MWKTKVFLVFWFFLAFWSCVTAVQKLKCYAVINEVNNTDPGAEPFAIELKKVNCQNRLPVLSHYRLLVLVPTVEGLAVRLFAKFSKTTFVGNDRFAIPGDCQNDALEAFPDCTLESTRRGLRPSDRPLSDDDYLRRASGARGCSVLA